MSDGAVLAADLSTSLQHLRESVEDADAAYMGSALRRSTRDDVVELALIRGMGLSEEYVGDLFLLALQARLGPEIAPIHLAADIEQAALYIAGVDGAKEARYISWMPLAQKTTPRAQRLLSQGQPFSRLSNRSSDKREILTLTTVRNRIAHDSASARDKFEELARSKGYPSTRGADYLTAQRGGTSEILLGLSTLQRIADGLADASEASSRTILGPEDSYEPDVEAPPGSYECDRNGHPKMLTAWGRLGSCAACPRPARCPSCGRVEKVKSQWNRH